MAIKPPKRKVAPKKDSATAADIVVVGNYKTRQLDWIKKNGVYNWPVREEDGHVGDADDAHGRGGAPCRPLEQELANVKELWLYANVKSERHVFAAQFVGKMTNAEFLAAYPSYAKLGPSKQKAYYVFKTTPVDYPAGLGSQIVLARTADFGKRCAKVKKAIEQFKQDGEFAPLAAYLPKELAKVPCPQLRVCEAAVQMDFLSVFDALNSCQIRDKVNEIRDKSGRNVQRHTCLDFFAGSGLVSQGLSNEFMTVWANDISEKKAQVFNANNCDGVLQVCPIENVNGACLPRVDLSWGSFPCQDLSLAGDMNGLYAARSGLFWQWLRVMDEMSERPTIVVAENVCGLVSAKGGEYYVVVHNELLKRGYRVGAVMLDAVHWLPQSRKRIFVVGVRSDIDVTGFVSDVATWCHPVPIVNVSRKVKDWTWWNVAKPNPRQITLDEVIDFSYSCDSLSEKSSKLALISQTSIDKIKELSTMRRRAFTGYRRTRNHKQVLEIRTDGIAGCLRTPGGGSSRQIVLIANKGKLDTRLLTVREAARLMGAPDTFQIPGSYNDGYMAMGDAVAVPVVQFLSQSLLAPLVCRAKGV